MKPLFPSLLASLLLVGATSCSKTDATPQETYFVQAKKNLFTSWSGKGSGSFIKSKKEFYIFGLLGDAAYAESLSLGVSLPAYPQLTPVRALQAHWTAVVGYDGVGNSYATEAASLPTIEITRLDTVAKVVEGRFNATLVRDKHWTSTTSQPEIMNFNDGSFRVQYVTYP
jgi:hypothetical protein